MYNIFIPATVPDPNDPDPSIAADFLQKAELIRYQTDLHPDFATAIYRYTTRQGASLDEQQDLLTLKSWIEGQPVQRPVLRGFGISEARFEEIRSVSTMGWLLFLGGEKGGPNRGNGRSSGSIAFRLVG